MAKGPPDPRYASIRVDSNFFHDTIEPLERGAADKLMELHHTLEISLALPFSVRAELDHPSTPESARKQASELIFTIGTGMGSPQRLEVVKRIFRGNSADDRHDADASHVYDAVVWNAGYFVTMDKRIHKKVPELTALFGDLWVVKPSQLLEAYEDWVSRRS